MRLNQIPYSGNFKYITSNLVVRSTVIYLFKIIFLKLKKIIITKNHALET